MENNDESKKITSNTFLSAADLMPSDKTSQNILHTRAQLFAKSNKENKQMLGNPYICFILGDSQEKYGIPYRYIQGIINDASISLLPCVPNYIAGIINHRGNLIAVVDLKLFFHSQPTKYKESSTIILIKNSEITLGILADNIEGSDFYASEVLEPPFAFPDIIKPELIIGLHRGVTAIINVEELMLASKSHVKK